MASLLTVGVVLFGAIFILALVLGLFCAAVSLATSRLGEGESEPHRPLWREPETK